MRGQAYLKEAWEERTGRSVRVTALQHSIGRLRGAANKQVVEGHHLLVRADDGSADDLSAAPSQGTCHQRKPDERETARFGNA